MLPISEGGGDGMAASVVPSLNTTLQTTLVATITAIMLVADDLLGKSYKKN
jgi:hypothetical protein